jgi:hypothetical protein
MNCVKSAAAAVCQALVIGTSIAILVACGGKSSTLSGGGSTNPIAPAASNVAAAVVNAGPSGNDVNTLFTSVTICVPGSTTSCQTIDDIEIDTGSSGLRVLASALSLSLPTVTDTNGNNLLECTQFVDGVSWGPIATADLTVAGETAASLPIQVIGDTTFSSVPADCSSIGTVEDTVSSFGANGILGIGVFTQDCGVACTIAPANGVYYACSSPTECTAITLALTSQVPNPATYFATDNNGVIIELPGVATTGAATVTGSIVFGVDTETNNASGKATVITVGGDGTSDAGNFTTNFNSASYDASFFDAGSNGLYFNDSSLTECPGTPPSGYYCPAGTENFAATVVGLNNASANVNFSVANADTLFNGGASLTAFANLAGTFPQDDSFDWGLPFFFGRNVYFVFEGKSTSVGTGPYNAF